MKSGLYAVASLNGAPLLDSDCRQLGFHIPPLLHERHADGFAVHAVDTEENSRAIHFVTQGDCVAAFLGHLDEMADLAALLGAASNASPAELALAALERFGEDAPSRMLGEWCLLRWHVASRELTLLASEACRDPMFFATDGKRVVVSPEVRRLAGLDWVGAAFDPKGLALQMSRARLRRIMTGETFLRGVTRVVPGTREIFAAGKRSTSAPRPPLQPEPWRGTFEDAVAALEDVLRRIVRQNLQRHGTAAFLLSGGLDSSLLAWLGSQECSKDQEMFFLTSVAPAGSGIADEREFSEAIAQRLGLPVTFVVPPESASVYRPSARMFAHAELPVASARHYLYDALYDAALVQGADVLFDGVYGELTLTNKSPRASLRTFLRQTRARLRSLREPEEWPASAFHARLSKDALAALPSEWAGEWRAPFAPDPALRAKHPFGFRPAVRKNAMTASSNASLRFRHLMPFRDRRLLRLAASMPAAFLHHGGMNRALARAMLKDRLPDSVRLRLTGRPFSPDYDMRLRAQAPLAAARMDLFRAAGAEEWLDLHWLADALAHVGDGRPMNIADAFAIQTTAVAAEFFVWWKAQARA